MEKRAVRYIRVSRQDQRPELQADETGEFIERRGWTLADTFLDQGISGTKDRRPALDELMAAAKRRRFDVLVVYRADRLFRSLRHMVVALDELAALGIGFVSVTEPFDSTTPQGRLLIQLVSAFAEFERNVIAERTRAGIAAARRRGARIGRPPVYVDVARARVMRAKGASLRTIAKALKVGTTTLFRALQEADGPEAVLGDNSPPLALEVAGR